MATSTFFSFDYKKIGKQAFDIFEKYKVVVISIIILVALGFVLSRVNQIVESAGDFEQYVGEESEQVKTVVFDEDTIIRINELNDSNIKIDTSFSNRDNPFSE